jgi:hypothetical protein
MAPAAVFMNHLTASLQLGILSSARDNFAIDIIRIRSTGLSSSRPVDALAVPIRVTQVGASHELAVICSRLCISLELANDDE